MERQWWYSEKEEQHGPIPESDLIQLIVSQTLGPQTLVWSDDMSQWECLKSLPELAQHFPQTPPPLPKEQKSSFGDDFSALSVAGAWRRFIARLIDLWVIGIPIGLITGMLLGMYSIESLNWMYEEGSEFKLSVILLPVVLLVEWIFYCLFSATPGKAILGILVVDMRGHKLSRAGYAKRLLLLWPQGLAIGIPLLNFIAFVIQYRKVNANQSTSYDESLAVVRARPMGWLRTIGATVLGIVLFSAAASLNYFVKKQEILLQEGLAWVNPVTQIETQLPPGWLVTAGENTDKQPVYFFTSTQAPVMAVFAEESAPGYSLRDYSELWVKAVADQMSYPNEGKLKRVLHHVGLIYKGHVTYDPTQRTEAYIVRTDDAFWRVVLLAENDIDPISYDANRVREMLLKTLSGSHRPDI